MNENIFHFNQEFHLESGTSLPGFHLTYSIWGKLNKNKDNVIWVCHALTANSDVADWWAGLFGTGKFYDPEKYFIVCANVLGGCYGSTGPLSINPLNNKPYFHDFPILTIRDMVKALDHLRLHLEIDSIHTCLGGSLGGQQVLEWSIILPQIFKNIMLIATNAQHSAWGIAFNESQRMAIEADQTWRQDHEDAGKHGLNAARSIALLSYRNYQTYVEKQSESDSDKTDEFKASSYQNYQGLKLVKRFNAFTYWCLSKAMDSHNVGRKRESVFGALSHVTANALVIGIKSDFLFPINEQKILAKHIPNAIYKEIDSLYGHDGFLIETEKITALLKDFYVSAGKNKNLQFMI